MSDFLVTGRKGSGKSLVVVRRMRDALRQGRPVATNFDLNLENMLPPGNRSARCYRLPDFPSLEDLEAIGEGNREVDEDCNGLVVLDELAVFLNARTFQDKRREGVLRWLVHSRKMGWDTYLLAQHPNQIDKQIRESQAEYHVVCRRLDKLKIPLLGVRLPKVHLGFVKYGMEHNAVMAERWVFRGRDVYSCYDTRQKFTADYSHGLFMYLPPGYLNLPSKLSILDRWRSWRAAKRPYAMPKPRLPLVELLTGLPVDERLKHWRRLDALGAFRGSAASPG